MCLLSSSSRRRFAPTASASSPPEYRVYGSARDVILVLTHTATQVPGQGWNAYRATDPSQRDPTSPLGWRWVAHQSTRLPSEGNDSQLPGAVLDAYVGRYRTPGEAEARTVGRDGGTAISMMLALTSGDMHLGDCGGARVP